MDVNPIDFVSIRGGILIRNGEKPAAISTNDPSDLYRALGYGYPKFFKMDTLCKWAWLGAEALLRSPDGEWLFDGRDKQKIAVVIATKDGCLEVDQRYQDSMKDIPSPALFVYTLPNIMLGEICIRHGFTGEQLCQVQDTFDAEALLFWARELTASGNTTHCLFGWADAVSDHHHVSLFWADVEALKRLDIEQLQTVHNKPVFRQ
jgi:hypothetical protein